MTIHVAMNIAAKDMMYLEARRVVGPGGADLPRDFRTGDYLRDCPPNRRSGMRKSRFTDEQIRVIG
jgi:hypothetical protein